MQGPQQADGMFARKPLEAFSAQAEKSGFRKSLNALDLTGLGIAAVIGAGIFVLMGQAARSLAGPWIVASILLAGLASIGAAFAYAELASMVRGSGSAYGYAYAALGKLPAFMMGWLVLNAYAVGNMTVAIGWNNLLTDRLAAIGLAIPARWSTSPMDDGGQGLFNVPAALVMILVTILCLPRIRESTRVNNVLVALKLAIVLFVIAMGFTFVDASNWADDNVMTDAGLAPVTWQGVVSAAALVFFAYLGFDTVAATAEESRNPRRDLPIGILASIGIPAVLYMLMGAVVTGMQPAATLDAGAPVTSAFAAQGAGWAAGLIGMGALVGLFTVMYAFQVALTRILHAMANDGFLPGRFGLLNPRTGTPWTINLWTGALTALGAGLLDLADVADMTVLASIFMYVLVNAGVLVLRRLRPDAARGFKAPLWIVAAGVLLMLGLAYVGIQSLLVHFVFLAWVGLGFALYGFYGHRAALRRAGELGFRP